MTELSIRPEEIRDALDGYVRSYEPGTASREEVGRVIDAGDVCPSRRILGPQDACGSMGHLSTKLETVRRAAAGCVGDRRVGCTPSGGTDPRFAGGCQERR